MIHPATRPPLWPADLPLHLAERVPDPPPFEAPLRPVAPDGRWILYWMRTAMRAAENPALDVALTVAARLDLPVLVYQGLDARGPYANDRHHTFILEGALDVAADLARLGVRYLFHLDRPGHTGPHLRRLAEASRLVVTEAMPVPFLRRWTAALAQVAPVWSVDTAHVVPLSLSREAPRRAFEFRDRFAATRAARLTAPWPAAPSPRPWPGDVADGGEPGGDLHAWGFEPLTLPHPDAPTARAQIAAWVAECPIDHGVAPVPESRGGTRAGLARWRAFCADHLSSYHRRRNHPTDPEGSSRLSPWLHYGMVSPLQIAREAALPGALPAAQAAGAAPQLPLLPALDPGGAGPGPRLDPTAARGDGAEKFLDELLIWRELAGHWAWHTPALESTAALPPWARQSLEHHRLDPREPKSWETLARARSGSPLWDLCQTSLLRHGELHNQLRMTWGKALPVWTQDAAEALRLLVDLNHRYALDGRDPSSYGGLLYCLGLFDRPFTPETPVLGAVRARPLEAQAQRLPMSALAAHIGRSRTGTAPLRVAVIGAGVAGLACARTLQDHGLSAVVFDKGRGPGGRMATRRAPEARFDHGAQFFTAQDAAFRRHVASWLGDGVVARWSPRVLRIDAQGEVGAADDRGDRPWYVGAPSMSALTRHLAADLAVQTDWPVHRTERRPDGWYLWPTETPAGGAGSPHATGAAGPFDRVLVAVPAPQATALVTASPGLAGIAQAARLAPCWTVMLRLAPGPVPDFDALRAAGALAWAAREASKPGRSPSADWVLQASTAWSAAHLEAAPEAVAAALVSAFQAAWARVAPALPAPVATEAHAHRWRHALGRGAAPDGPRAHFDHDTGLGLAGDWLGAGRVESAWLSGVALAAHVLAAASPRLPVD